MTLHLVQHQGKLDLCLAVATVLGLVYVSGTLEEHDAISSTSDGMSVQNKFALSLKDECSMCGHAVGRFFRCSVNLQHHQLSTALASCKDMRAKTAH